MNNTNFAKDYLYEANLRMETAENVLRKEAYAYCVRQCQEAVELSLKAALRIVGLDYPKWHDIGNILVIEKEKFPEIFQKNITKLTSISNLLMKYREPAMYGDEKSSKTPSSLFNKEVAEKALKDTKFCLEKVENLFELFLNKNIDKK